MTRHVTTSIGATALQAQFDAEPVVRYHVRPVENVVVPISRRLQLVQLSERTCKWPNGDPLSEDFSLLRQRRRRDRALLRLSRQDRLPAGVRAAAEQVGPRRASRLLRDQIILRERSKNRGQGHRLFFG